MRLYILIFSLMGSIAHGYANYCVERSNGTVRSLCPGRNLPSGKVRNFHQRSQEMLCTGNVDHYIRSPQKYDFNTWETMRQAGQNQEAFDLRRKLPDIKWDGRIPYSTIEAWTWEECSLGTNGAICGFHQECHTETYTEAYTDANGKMQSSTKTREVCVQVPNTCWYDQDRYEEWHCTNEIMTLNAQYARPSTSEWNIENNKADAEFLPNKYDLLPGEVEDVQIFNTRNKASIMDPAVVIGDAWNKYTPYITGSGMGARCIPHQKYHIDVVIQTNERDRTKPSPNAFRLPVDHLGNALDPISEWHVETVEGKEVKVKPRKLRLQDVSAAVVTAVSNHSMKNSDREKTKAEKGLEGNKDKITKKDYDSFFKNTVIRAYADKINSYWFDERATNRAYADDSTSVTPSLNILSKDQEVALSDFWEVNLDPRDSDNKSNLYRMKSLRPNRSYKLYVSMYQKGVPFYQQSCEYNPEQSGCGIGWYIPFYGVHEGDYFSKPLAIPFSTEPGYDERGFFRRYMEASFFEWLVHERVKQQGEKQ